MSDISIFKVYIAAVTRERGYKMTKNVAGYCQMFVHVECGTFIYVYGSTACVMCISYLFTVHKNTYSKINTIYVNARY